MRKWEEKVWWIEKLSNEEGIIWGLGFDEGGGLKRMMGEDECERGRVEEIEELKVVVCEELSKYVSWILLDGEYGLRAWDGRNNDWGLLVG